MSHLCNSILVLMSFASYKHHSKANPPEKRRVTQKTVESELERVPDQSSFTKQPSTVQGSTHQAARLCCNWRPRLIPTNLSTYTCKSATLPRMWQFHTTRPLAMGETALASLKIDPVAEHNTFALDKPLVRTKMYAVQRSAAKWSAKSVVAFVGSSSGVLYSQVLP